MFEIRLANPEEYSYRAGIEGSVRSVRRSDEEYA